MTCWVQYCQLFDDQRPVYSLTHSQFLNDHLINWAVYMYWLLLWLSRISSIDWFDAYLRLSANNYFSPWIMIKALRYRKYIFYFCICWIFFPVHSLLYVMYCGFVLATSFRSLHVISRSTMPRFWWYYNIAVSTKNIVYVLEKVVSFIIDYQKW